MIGMAWRRLAAAGSALVLATALAGCGAEGAVDNADGGGERLASSFTAYAEQLMDAGPYGYGTPSGTQRAILERIIEQGEVTARDYAQAWSNYVSCVTDKGYPAPTYVAMSNGIYQEQGMVPPPEHNDDLEYGATMAREAGKCSGAEWGSVHELYMVQAGNPGLYADHAEGAVDCLKRAGLVPQSFTAEQYRRETDIRSNAEPVDDPVLDQESEAVRSCMAANGVRFEMLD